MNKYIRLLGLLWMLISTIQPALATEDCGMIATDAQSELLLKQRELRKQMISSLKIVDEGEMIYIPITAHIIRDDAGKQGYSEGDLYPLLCQVNQFFKPVNMYLYLKGDVRYVDDQSLFWTYNAGELYTIIDKHMKASYVDSTINIYFCNFFSNANGQGLCGAAPFPFMDIQYFNGVPAGVVMNKTCSQPMERTLPHELGHHFNLLHTFQGSNSASATFNEYVTREAGVRNCETAGDGFCDTEADTLFYVCPYNGSTLDLRGEARRPDESLLMSYYTDECQNRYSPEELDEVRSVAYNDPRRNQYRMYGGTPDISPVGPLEIALRTPANNATLPWNNINFSWKPVAGANKYLWVINEASSGNLIAEIATKDTFLVYSFDNVSFAGKKYNWSVKAYREGNMCSSYVFFRAINASAATSVAINFLDAATLVVYPNPVFGTAPINLAFNGKINTEAVLRVIDISGRTMLEETLPLQQGANEISIPGQELANGIYTISLQDKSGIITRKLVIQR